jgi:hypothetical protein
MPKSYVEFLMRESAGQFDSLAFTLLFRKMKVRDSIRPSARTAANLPGTSRAWPPAGKRKYERHRSSTALNRLSIKYLMIGAKMIEWPHQIGGK